MKNARLAPSVRVCKRTTAQGRHSFSAELPRLFGLYLPWTRFAGRGELVKGAGLAAERAKSADCAKMQKRTAAQSWHALSAALPVLGLYLPCVTRVVGGDYLVKGVGLAAERAKSAGCAEIQKTHRRTEPTRAFSRAARAGVELALRNGAEVRGCMEE